MDFFAKSFFGDGFLFFGGAAHLKVRVSDVEVVVFFSIVLVLPLIVLMLFKAQGN